MSFPTFQPTKPNQLKRAQALRKSMTDPEKRLWWALRHRLPTHKFRRQVPIGPYIVDFCCLSARLVVEVDGNQHGTDAARTFDAKRTALIETHDFRVVRFGNDDVMRGLDSVLNTLFALLSEAENSNIERVEGPPPLAPPRKGEGMPHA